MGTLRAAVVALFALAAAVLAAAPAAAQGDVFVGGAGGSGAGQDCLQRCNMKTIASCRARDYAACRKDMTACRKTCYAKPSGDVFSSDDRPSGDGAAATAQAQACQNGCVNDFAEGAFGDPPCANFKLERCVHKCACGANPDCGPAPRHKEEAQSCPDAGGGAAVAGGTSGGGKGLTRKQCQEEGAKGIFRKECEQLVRADCAQFGSKGIFRRECEELRKKDCADAAAKGIRRPGCEELAPPVEKCGPGPAVSVSQLASAMNACLAKKLNWYVPAKLVASPGVTAVHARGSSTISYDPAFLQSRSLYEKTFFLAGAFGDYVVDLEGRRFGTARATDERAAATHFIAGQLTHCLGDQGLSPPVSDECPSPIEVHGKFLQSFERSLVRTGPAPGSSKYSKSLTHTPRYGQGPSEVLEPQDAWEFGYFDPGTPITLAHWPRRDVFVRMQQVLNLLGYPAGKPDGAWGAQTASALRAFQADQGLEVWSYPSDQSIQALIGEAEKKLGAPEEMLRDYLTSFPGASPSP